MKKTAIAVVLVFGIPMAVAQNNEEGVSDPDAMMEEVEALMDTADMLRDEAQAIAEEAAHAAEDAADQADPNETGDEADPTDPGGGENPDDGAPGDPDLVDPEAETARIVADISGRMAEAMLAYGEEAQANPDGLNKELVRKYRDAEEAAAYLRELMVIDAFSKSFQRQVRRLNCVDFDDADCVSRALHKAHRTASRYTLGGRRRKSRLIDRSHAN